MQNIDMFNNEERIVINSICKGSAIKDLTKTRLLNGLVFAFEVSTDADIIALLRGLIAKVDSLTEEAWTKMRMFLPFETFSEADEEETAGD